MSNSCFHPKTASGVISDRSSVFANAAREFEHRTPALDRRDRKLAALGPLVEVLLGRHRLAPRRHFRLDLLPVREPLGRGVRRIVADGVAGEALLGEAVGGDNRPRHLPDVEVVEVVAHRLDEGARLRQEGRHGSWRAVRQLPSDAIDLGKLVQPSLPIARLLVELGDNLTVVGAGQSLDVLELEAGTLCGRQVSSHGSRRWIGLRFKRLPLRLHLRRDDDEAFARLGRVRRPKRDLDFPLPTFARRRSGTALRKIYLPVRLSLIGCVIFKAVGRRPVAETGARQS